MTELIYMNDFDVVTCEASVVKTEEHEGKDVIVLDQTCFYAKGGGQDFDQGVIKSEDVEFQVEAVFFVDGEVKHIGSYTTGKFAVGDKVACEVDVERRNLNSRLHSAGHVIDMAVRELGWDWKPGKGAHYPHMAFVEYEGPYDAEEKQKLIEQLQDTLTKMIKAGSTNSIKFMTPEEMAETGAFVPDNLPKGKPSRAVFYDDFAVPCGGTHVKDIKDIGSATITNMKRKDGNVRVSYKVD